MSYFSIVQQHNLYTAEDCRVPYRIEAQKARCSQPDESAKGTVFPSGENGRERTGAPSRPAG
jgi:hypothetical protein